MSWKNDRFMGSESPLSGGKDALLQSWKGREAPQDKSKAMQQMLLVTQWVSGFPLEGQIVFFCKSQRTAEHAVTMSLTEYQELSPKLTDCILNSLLFLLSMERNSCCLFMKSLFFCACLFTSPGIDAGQVPGCSLLLSREPWMLGSSVLCRPHSHDREIGWHMTLHRIKS